MNRLDKMAEEFEDHECTSSLEGEEGTHCDSWKEYWCCEEHMSPAAGAKYGAEQMREWVLESVKGTLMAMQVMGNEAKADLLSYICRKISDLGKEEVGDVSD